MQTPQQRNHIEKVYSEMMKHLEHYNFNPVLITKENILQYIDKLADDEEERHRPDFFIGNRAEMPNKMFISVGAQVYENFSYLYNIKNNKNYLKMVKLNLQTQLEQSTKTCKTLRALITKDGICFEIKQIGTPFSYCSIPAIKLDLQLKKLLADKSIKGSEMLEISFLHSSEDILCTIPVNDYLAHSEYIVTSNKQHN